MEIRTITGNIGQPERKQVGENNTTVVNFGIAVNSMDRNGNQATGWTNCAVWGKRGDYFFDKYSKGDQVMVSGQMNYNEGTDGNTYGTLNVGSFRPVGFSPNDRQENGGGQQQQQSQQKSQNKSTSSSGGSAQSNDDLPF